MAAVTSKLKFAVKNVIIYNYYNYYKNKLLLRPSTLYPRPRLIPSITRQLYILYIAIITGLTCLGSFETS
jgi:hypothetical protein